MFPSDATSRRFFIEDGRVRRGLEAAVELAPTAAARERIIDMFSMVAMSELYEIVEAVVAAACATPEGVRAIKATGRELGASVPTEKESAVVRAGALIEGVHAVCASARAALRTSALFGHGGAAVLEVLAVPPSAAKMMKDLRYSGRRSRDCSTVMSSLVPTGARSPSGKTTSFGRCTAYARN